MPKKHALAVDNPDAAFKKFEDLTRRLLTVPREELNESLRRYGEQARQKKAKRIRSRKKS